MHTMMHDPSRSRHPIASLAEAIRRLVNAKMEDQESLISYDEKVKQAKDTLKSHSGTKILDEFVAHTEEHKKAVAEGNSALQKEMKDDTFDQWVSHSMADNTCHEKFGSLQSGSSSQCALSTNIQRTLNLSWVHQTITIGMMIGKKRSKRRSKERSVRKMIKANRMPTQKTMRRMSLK